MSGTFEGKGDLADHTLGSQRWQFREDSLGGGGASAEVHVFSRIMTKTFFNVVIVHRYIFCFHKMPKQDFAHVDSTKS